MKKLILFLFVILNLGIAKETTTYWHSNLPDNWEVYYEIKQKDNHFSGKFVSYLNGMQFAGDDMGEVKITKDSISMVTNIKANIIYKGEFNSDCTNVKGANFYPDGSRLEISLEKLKNPFPDPFYPRQNCSLISRIIEKHEDGIATSSIEKVDFSIDAVKQLIERILSRDVGEIHAVLIAKDNKLVLEEYFYDYDVDKIHRIHSCTKSIISLLAGKAFENGNLPSIETTMDQLFPDLKMKKKLKQITFADLFGMTSGFGELFVELDSPDDWKSKLFTIHPKTKAGKKFRYDDNNSHLIGFLLSQGTDQKIDDYAKTMLFKPLGIEQYHWEHIGDQPTANTGLALRARDLLKVGFMVADDGKWQGQQIISSEWITKSTQPRINAVEYFDYGFHWWSIQGKEFGFQQNIPVAQGAGGQRLIIVPELNVVCVIFGGNFEMWNSLEEDIWKIIKN